MRIREEAVIVALVMALLLLADAHGRFTARAELRSQAPVACAAPIDPALAEDVAGFAAALVTGPRLVVEELLRLGGWVVNAAAAGHLP